jgi:hypothetical protein
MWLVSHAVYDLCSLSRLKSVHTCGQVSFFFSFLFFSFLFFSFLFFFFLFFSFLFSSFLFFSFLFFSFLFFSFLFFSFLFFSFCYGCIRVSKCTLNRCVSWLSKWTCFIANKICGKKQFRTVQTHTRISRWVFTNLGVPCIVPVPAITTYFIQTL